MVSRVSLELSDLSSTLLSWYSRMSIKKHKRALSSNALFAIMLSLQTTGNAILQTEVSTETISFCF